MRVGITQDLPSATGRSLVAVDDSRAAIGSAAGGGPARPSAAFLAQLVAIAQGAPQTRARRRATAGHAAALYAAAAGRIERPSVIKACL
jgi:hypothetical protein